jgi:putative ABC transport system permease protein
VPTISVSYWAFAGPACLSIGAGLLSYRFTDLLLSHGERAVTAAIRPVAGDLSSTVAASLRRQRRFFATSKRSSTASPTSAPTCRTSTG